MAQNYFSIVTNKGRNKLALSAAGGDEVTITHFAIGDGNGGEVNPTPASTALVREVWRTPAESVVIDPLNPSAVLVTAIIPTGAGGWWMREFGIFDRAGDMIAVAKPVSQYKPTALEGQLEDIRYEFQIIIGETANVTMLVDPSVMLASREWVINRKIPMGQLMRLPWVPVISMTVTAPPAAQQGDTYLVPDGATGAWAGHSGKLAEWSGAAWALTTPPNGHGISLPDGRIFLRYNGGYIEKIAQDVQSGQWNVLIAGGTARDITATMTPVRRNYPVGIAIRLQTLFAAAGSTLLTIDGQLRRAIVRADGSDIMPLDWVAGEILELVFNGTSWQAVGLAGASREWVNTRKTPVAQLNALPWLPIQSMTLTAPQAAPAAGDIYLVPVGATGAWAGQAGKLAEWSDTEWVFISTGNGHGVSLPDGRIFEKVAGTYVEKIALDAQSGKWMYAAAGGTANALTVTLTPPLTAYAAGVVLAVKIAINNTGPATVNVNGRGAIPIQRSDGGPLQKDDLVAGQIASLMCTGSAFQVDGLKSSQTPARNMWVQSAAGTYSFVVPTGVYKVYGICVGGGGGAGGQGARANGSSIPAGGGGSGGTAEGWIDVTPGQTVTVIVGGGGAGGAAGSGPGVTGSLGSVGGTSSIGSYMSATGGGFGGTWADGTGGGTGGNGIGGQIVKIGGAGGDGSGALSSELYAGNGGASSMGGGGRAATGYDALYCDGKAPGSGGGAVYAGFRNTNKGGNGAPGIVIIQY